MLFRLLCVVSVMVVVTFRSRPAYVLAAPCTTCTTNYTVGIAPSNQFFANFVPETYKAICLFNQIRRGKYPSADQQFVPPNNVSDIPPLLVPYAGLYQAQQHAENMHRSGRPENYLEGEAKSGQTIEPFGTIPYAVWRASIAAEHSPATSQDLVSALSGSESALHWLWDPRTVYVSVGIDGEYATYMLYKYRYDANTVGYSIDKFCRDEYNIVY
ncbi:hypothetical protein EV182_003615 [Spiromyces aspiralis]|uniref:Uncharacterized protein n=1 Tax=Spiromyces aspiralis TaxID=68401 RepID=A0ACC1HGP2_9FUNG|nr:hypothetical protein EV182_003615 [Spiromyces aspiralis]